MQYCAIIAELNSTQINGVGFTLAQTTLVGLVVTQINSSMIEMFPEIT